MQEGNDSEMLIDGYVSMLNKLTNALLSAQQIYSSVFAEFVLVFSISFFKF